MSVSGEQLGAYTLLERIGAGGMGEVWKGEDTRLGRMVAIKILPQRIANDSEAIARMRREARPAAQLSHPNIATIHSFEETGGRLFIVMEYVDGEPLTKRIERGPMPESLRQRRQEDVEIERTAAGFYRSLSGRISVCGRIRRVAAPPETRSSALMGD